MRRIFEQFDVRVKDNRRSEERQFVAGKHFRIDCQAITDFLRVPLSDRMIDLLRIASTAYFADRLIRRDRSRGTDGWPRDISCSIKVRDLDFWGQPEIRELVEDTVGFVSGDRWAFEFAVDKAESNYSRYLALRDTPPVVCLYSGGLDSAAGLAHRLAAGISRPIIPVVVRHRSDIGSAVLKQLEWLGGCFCTKLRPLTSMLSMIRPRKLWAEESSQRARSFLFVSVGCVVSWATDSPSLELYESGIGAINAPLLASMEGSQATRSCHPTFLRKMSRLVSLAADRQVAIQLPFRHLTKGEVAKSLVTNGLQDLAMATTSCVSYPLRQATGKSCGVCPACIFRRLALHTAGIQERRGSYQIDLLDAASIISPRKLKYLKAFLLLVDHLTEINEGHLPIVVTRHLLGTGALENGESEQPYLDLYRRYRTEWLNLLQRARTNGCKWSGLIDPSGEAA
jgi:hypothetical protein